MEKMERKIAINNVACIQFRPRIPSDQYYISFYKGEECSSPVVILIYMYILTYSNFILGWTNDR
jgi:hypothetical protein